MRPSELIDYDAEQFGARDAWAKKGVARDGGFPDVAREIDDANDHLVVSTERRRVARLKSIGCPPRYLEAVFSARALRVSASSLEARGDVGTASGGAITGSARTAVGPGQGGGACRFANFWIAWIETSI